MKTPTLIALAVASGAICMAPNAAANNWNDLAAAAEKNTPEKHQRGAHYGNRDSTEQRRDRRRDYDDDDRLEHWRDHRRDHRHDHRRNHHQFDRHPRNVRRAMRRHGISRFDHAVWTGHGFRVSGFTAHGLIDIVFGYPHYAVHSVAHRGRHWDGWNHGPRYRDDYRPRHNNRRPLRERRVRRIAYRRYGMDVYRTRCVNGRWILIGHRHGHRHGRYKLVLDAYTGRELAFHRLRGHR